MNTPSKKKHESLAAALDAVREEPLDLRLTPKEKEETCAF